MMTRIVATAISVLFLSLLPVTQRTEQRQSDADVSAASEPAQVETFTPGSSKLVDGRFLIATIERGSNFNQHARDLLVVDLVSGRHERVLGRAEAGESLNNSIYWDDSFLPRAKKAEEQQCQTRFPGLLVISSSAPIANHDESLASGHGQYVYLYDLQAGKRWQISPPHYCVTQTHFRAEDIIMTLERDQEAETMYGQMSIYTYSTAAREGRFVVRDLKP